MSDQARDLTQSENERLSLIRYQLLAIGEALAAPPPLNTLAINLMQDVVESALAAVGEHVRATVPGRADFDKLFDAVITALGSPNEVSGLRAPAIALNNARVGFKHHGNQVPDGTLRRHQDVATTLVRELVFRGFGVHLDAVSLLLFIPHLKVREFIETAEAAHRRNDLKTALSYLRVAFDLTVDDYCDRKSVDGWNSIFDIEPRGASRVSFDEFGIGQLTEGLKAWVSALDARTRLAAIGVDLSRYAYFDAVAPVSAHMHHAGRGPYMHFRFEGLTDEHYRSSYSFVLDTAVRLAASDYNLREVSRSSRTPDTYDPAYRSPQWLENERQRSALRARMQGDDGSTVRGVGGVGSDHG